MKILRLLSVVLFATALSHQEAIAGPKAQSGPGIPVPEMQDLFQSPAFESCMEVGRDVLECICAITAFCTPNGPVEMTCEDLCFSACYSAWVACRDRNIQGEDCDKEYQGPRSDCGTNCLLHRCGHKL